MKSIVKIPGYQAGKQIYKCKNYFVFRGVREADNQAVLLKIPNIDEASPPVSDLYQYEFTILNSLKQDGIVRALDLIKCHDRPVLIFKDIGAKLLSNLLVNQTFSMTERLAIALRITEAIDKVHRAGFIHRQINPANILYNPETSRVQLINFELATELITGQIYSDNPEATLQTMAYVAPEQTGKMSRSLEYQSDLYSLGATLYELFCGKRVFQSDNLIELIHSHIAIIPTPPSQTNPLVPSSLSNIIMKLLSKETQDRYRCAAGLKHDLRWCLEQYKKKGHIGPFILQQHDISEQFRMSSKIYGRENEIDILMQAFSRARKGGLEQVLVTGSPGIGKTALVREALQRIATTNAEATVYLGIGKFDQFHQDIPYSAIVQALKDIIRQILSENDKALEKWRQRLRSAFGQNGCTIADIIPEIEFILGPQPMAPNLGPLEAQNRLNLVFQNFVRALSGPSHPLIFFLDDIQWADTASIKLIETLLTGDGLNYFLAISTCRDDELDSDHPVHTAMTALNNKKVRITPLQLRSLNLESVNSLIADSFHANIYHASELGALILQKTDGNPFFVEMFLKTLRSENLLFFDSDRAQWQWNISRIKQLAITDNVVDLLTRKIQLLSEKTRDLLESAACIGIEFDLPGISTISKLPAAEMGDILKEAVAEGILRPLDTVFQYTKDNKLPDQNYSPNHYQFAHGRIRKTIYASMATDKRKHCHAHIGLSMLQNLSDSQKKERLFTITNHLNLGGNYSLFILGKDTLIKLNLDAGITAMQSVAFHPAYNYFKHGIQILGKDGWKDSCDIAKFLFEKAAEAAYLCGYYDEMDRLTKTVLKSGNSLLEKINTYETIIKSYIARYQADKAICIAIGTARDLSVRLSDKTSKWRFIKGYLSASVCLAWKNIDDLANLKKMTDPAILSVMRIMKSAGSAAYFSNQDLLAIMAFKGVQLSTKFGNAPESAFWYAVYGLILCGVIGDINSGYQFGELALNLIKKDTSHNLAPQTGHLVNAFIKHWKIHVRDTLTPLEDAYKNGLECGDLEYGGYGALFFCYHSFVAGIELSEVEGRMAEYSSAVDRLKHEFTLICLNVYRQVVTNLIDENSDPLLLSGPYYKEDEQLQAHQEANDKTTLSAVYLNKLYLNYLFNNYAKARYYASLAEEYLDGMTGMISIPLFYFYDSLTQLALYPELKAYDKNKAFNKVASNQKKMKRWARQAPMNHLHRYDLVEAERLAVIGHRSAAEKYYQKALELSQRHGYQNDEALILERTAVFYASDGKNQLATDTMLEARAAFEKWGAMAKVRGIDKAFTFLQADRHPGNQTKGQATVVNLGKRQSPIEKDLDMAAIMKATRAISREIVLEKLLGQLMRIIIENAGAQRGFLILKKEGELWIEASAMANSDKINAHHSIPLEKCEGLPINIIRYVEHTKEPMIIQNVTEDDQFFNNPFAIQRRLKSILCMPLLQKEKVVGVLYLENKLASHVFTKERIKILNILLAQAAISLENALLYENLKKEVSFRIEAEEKSLHLATAMEQTAEGIMTTDLHGVISYANPGCEKIYGYKTKELIGQKANIFYSHKEDPNFFESMKGTIFSGNAWSGHMSSRRKDGSIGELELTISPIKNEKGKVTSFVSVSRDMTHEIQMEKELRQAQKMEAMGTLAGGIAHDFNNILAAIMGYTELALLQAPPEKSIHQNLERVITSTKRAKDLVRQILAFSRQTDHEVRPIQLYALLKEALKMLRASLPSTIEFRQNIEESGYVEADPTQIHQVIMNLCTNAAQAMEKGGILTVSLKSYTVDKNDIHRYPELMPGSFLQLSVRDTGEGIEQKIIERIYEPFFTTKPPGKGTGMGLAMVHGIVKSCGGAIRVKSKVGQGAEFRILLPKYKGKRITSSETDAREVSPGQEHIMFVDDEKALVTLAEEGLQRIGYSVHIETDSEEALKIFKQNPNQFDLVITDQAMPKLTGTELSKELLKVRPDIPIILYSGLMEEIPQEQIELTGIRTLLSKPLLIKQLSKSIREILDKPAEVTVG